MACTSLGFWSFDRISSNICEDPQTIELYSDSGSYSASTIIGSGCPVTDYYIESGYYSNGTDVITVEPDMSFASIVTSITPCPSISGEYCIYNTTIYDGNYSSGGTYNSHLYYTGSTGYIFYSSGETRWCLASNLGNPCVQFGPYQSTSSTPDLDDTVMYTGSCITTTTTTNPCVDFNFEAIFDCLVPITPTPTPTPSNTPTPTPTPTSSNPCGGVTMSVTSSGYTPTPTPTMTPTPSPTPQVTRTCNFSGEVIFNAFSEILQCANSKKFKDCFTGIDYYTSDIVLVSGNTSPKEGYVYNAIINGQGYCVVYEGLFENISGVDNITLTNEIGSQVNGACLDCLPNLTSTPTPTPTSTPTPTPSPSPCVSYQYTITNQGPASVKFTYTTCNGSQSKNIPGFSAIIVCASVVPTTTSPNIQISPVGSIC